jgi:hypothetical protein
MPKEEKKKKNDPKGKVRNICTDIKTKMTVYFLLETRQIRRQ